jgi:hypothetical protein
MARTRAGVVVILLAIGLARCDGSDDTGQPAPTSTTGITGVQPTTTTAATSTSVAGAPTSIAPGSLGAPAGTSPYRVSRPATVPPVPKVSGVRTGAQTGYDRVVFDFSGALPGAESVEYVAALHADGSGAPVSVRGTAFLRVVFSVAEAHNADGSASFPQGRRIDPGLTSLQEVALLGDFEGYVTFGIGLAGKVGFRVFELSNPTRVVIDVARTP